MSFISELRVILKQLGDLCDEEDRIAEIRVEYDGRFDLAVTLDNDDGDCAEGYGSTSDDAIEGIIHDLRNLAAVCEHTAHEYECQAADSMAEAKAIHALNCSPLEDIAKQAE